MATIRSLAFLGAIVHLWVQLPAQTPSPPGFRVFTDTAYSPLGLSAAQRTDLRKLDRRFAKRLRKMGPASNTSFDALRSERLTQVKHILTAEQFKCWRGFGPSLLPYAEMPLLPMNIVLMPVPVAPDTVDRFPPVLWPGCSCD